MPQTIMDLWVTNKSEVHTWRKTALQLASPKLLWVWVIANSEVHQRHILKIWCHRWPERSCALHTHAPASVWLTMELTYSAFMHAFAFSLKCKRTWFHSVSSISLFWNTWSSSEHHCPVSTLYCLVWKCLTFSSWKACRQFVTRAIHMNYPIEILTKPLSGQVWLFWGFFSIGKETLICFFTLKVRVQFWFTKCLHLALTVKYATSENKDCKEYPACSFEIDATTVAASL